MKNINRSFFIIILFLLVNFTTTNAQWQQTGGLTGLPPVFTFATTDSALFVGTYEGVFCTTDNGNNWTAVNSGLKR